MPEVTLSINGKSYGISCEKGQEQRVLDLGRYVDAKLRDIAKAGAASTESHLLVLTTLLLADEVVDLRENIRHNDMQNDTSEEYEREEALIIQAIDSLADRIDLIADRIQKA